MDVHASSLDSDSVAVDVSFRDLLDEFLQGEAEKAGGPVELRWLSRSEQIIEVVHNTGKRSAHRRIAELRHLTRDVLRRRLQRLHPQVERWEIAFRDPMNDRVVLKDILGPETARNPSQGRRNLSLRPLEPQPLPTLDFAPVPVLRWLGGEESKQVVAVLTERLLEKLSVEIPFSRDYEEGGFFAGSAFRRADDPDRCVVVISDLIAAEHTGASRIHLTLTGDTFAQAKTVLRDRLAGRSLVGWYHTHLFPATDDFGLSTVDVQLHRGTFRQPWQVAGLVNLEDSGPSTVRFYCANDRGLAGCAAAVVEELPSESPAR
ncbi:MAG: hypothetical protein AAF196_04500 [Planctomycetota bacterium]